ncbi:MBL fold metallo-hydrolase [Aureivirga sp. CE67]|uniref:MBL fold metallo-hydrolase n=1 Tax=Aureivirga sp. CE67 TaxID=1788983 RepID=UPI0018CBC8AE|nr:MBL fold metallo-hydrolase [Aureivirga sp. CE67]
MSKNLNIEKYTGSSESEKSYLIYNNKNALLIDALRKSSEAKDILKTIKDKDLNLEYILVTHGHPDHFVGLGILKKEFPKVKIIVSNQGIKDEIIFWAKFMEKNGQFENESPMKLKSEKNKDGFDYHKEIKIFEGNILKLKNGGEFLISSNYSPSEADFISTVYSPDLNILFSSDLCYNKVHMWQAIDLNKIKNWKNHLISFKEKYNSKGIQVFPGHGEETDDTIFDINIKYMEDFQSLISQYKNKDKILEEMKSKYPEWKHGDFFLPPSIDFHLKNE